ncbi:tetratricopeptide repeat protein [Myxococcota bacterium]|nr:tetratricopeptide repeat protein [Myxococcota bacterium]
MTNRPDQAGQFTVLVMVILGAACFGLYESILEAPFTFDDYFTIVHQPAVRWYQIDLETLYNTVVVPYNQRPVANITFGLNYWFGQYEVFGYHAVNVAVHFANSLLVYAFVTATLQRWRSLPNQSGPAFDPTSMRTTALFAALLFAAHPLQVQSVTYVIQRMNSLSTFFYLSALLLYIRGREKPPGSARHIPYAGAVVSGLLALGCKQNAITLPVAVWLYEAFFFRDLDRAWMKRSAVRLAVPLVLVGGAIYYVLVYGPDLGYARRDFTLGERLLTQPRVVVQYLLLILLPDPSRMTIAQHVIPSTSLFTPPTTAGSMFVLLLLLAWAIPLARRWRIFSFSILWFFLHLVVESSILPLEMMFDHRTYLPLAGVVLAPAFAFATGRELFPRSAVVGAVLVVLVLIAGTLTRNATWQNNITLWADAVEKNPQYARAHSNLGMSHNGESRPFQAMVHFRDALEKDPNDVPSHRNLGAILSEMGDQDGALLHLQEAVRLMPDDFQAQGGLGLALYRAGRTEEAIEHHDASLAIYADERVISNLAKIWAEQGDSERAIFLLEFALDRNPEYIPAHLNLGVERLKSGQLSKAAWHFQRVLAEVEDAQTHAHLGAALWEMGHQADALQHLGTAHRMNPEIEFITNDLAWMLATIPDSGLRNPPQAMTLVQRSLQKHGADFSTLDTLGAAWAAIGEFDLAIEAAEQAAELARQDSDLESEAAILERADGYRKGRPYLERVNPTP